MKDVERVMRLLGSYNHDPEHAELYQALAGVIADAERYRFCVERNTMPVIAGDGETWCMFLAVKSSRRSLFTGATPNEAIDAAMAGANSQVQP
mgnify:CR=1 FL=1